ncbi:hypothetical protein AcV7_005322 [Taiwanofungus camphoratus]|nr:hypothetical protein AcV7_005322 [Antrodia cinnamomea]
MASPALTAHLRAVSLFLSFAFGVVGMSLGINALAKSHHQKHEIRNAAPQGAVVSINTHDVLASGVVVTVVCGLIALTSFLSASHGFITRRSKSVISRRTAPMVAGAVLGFLTIWLFATLVPFTDFVARRHSKVSATLGGVPIPANVIQSVQQALGVTPVYHKIHYLRNATILPWFAFLFGGTSSALSIAAARSFVPGAGTEYPVVDEKAAGDAAAGTTAAAAPADTKNADGS